MRVRKHSDEDDVEVSMSPLIDCVFLLLVFFLVTTMMKKKEHIIPIKQPRSTMSLAVKSTSDSNYIGIKGDLTYVRPLKQRDSYDRIVYTAVPDLDSYLSELVKTDRNHPLVIQVQRDVEFQGVLKVFDLCTTHGFTNVKTYSEADNFQSNYTKTTDEEGSK